jgi:hypothetical protein
MYAGLPPENVHPTFFFFALPIPAPDLGRAYTLLSKVQLSSMIRL